MSVLARHSASFSSDPNKLVYGCTALVGSNKTGVIKPDATGYYRFMIGALNLPNSYGAVYVVNSEVRALFDASSILQRRIGDGALRGEAGHPRQENMTDAQFLRRVIDIFEPNVCVHIRKIEVDFNGIQAPDGSGRCIVPIYGEICAAGPMGPALQKSLDNPSENVCFSIRSLTRDTMVGSQLQKTLRAIVTWDYVNEPGLYVAKKWLAPGLESLSETQFTRDHLRVVVDNTKHRGRGLEAAHDLAVELAHQLGWDHNDPNSPIALPRELGW